MNNTYYETLDENFNMALELLSKPVSHNELINLLRTGNIAQRQAAALRLETLQSEDDANILISNLTGQNGKIREAVSLKIKEFMSNPQLLVYFENTSSYDIFLDAIIDINANICRNIIEAVSNLKNNPEFSKYFCEKLAKRTNLLLDTVKDFDFQDGKYKVNKEVFKLYWCLETIYNFAYRMDFQTLKQILLQAKNIQEYTIREKTARILSQGFDDKELSAARQELKNDKNYYVRRF